MQSVKTRKPRLLKKDIHVTKNVEGAWVCQAIVDGFLEQHRYFWFTKREAIEDFHRRYA